MLRKTTTITKATTKTATTTKFIWQNGSCGDFNTIYGDSFTSIVNVQIKDVSSSIKLVQRVMHYIDNIKRVMLIRNILETLTKIMVRSKFTKINKN